MSANQTNAAAKLRSPDEIALWCGGRLALPVLSGMLALTGMGSDASGDSAHVMFQPPWKYVSHVGVGTTRVAIADSNRYQPQTGLGRRLMALRTAAIANGMLLEPVEKIVSELASFRG